MLKIIDLLMKIKLRRIKKIIRNNKFLSFSIALGLIYVFSSISIEDFLILNSYMVYIAWIANSYFVLKLINPTQGMTIHYQLIELKLITCREFKLLIAIKLYGSALVMLILYGTILKGKMILILLLVNCAVNVYVFLRSSYNSRFLDLIMAIYSCVCVYLNSLVLAVFIFVLITLLFVCLKIVHYDQLLPLYRMIYRIGLRYSGEVLTDTENDEISSESERLFGSVKQSSIVWFDTFYEKEICFHWMKEVARIYSNIDKFIMHIMISLIICFGVFYLPEWYRLLAIMASVSAAYEFCYIMHRTDLKLFPYGFIDHYNFLTILKRKWPVYSLVCLFIMLPLIFVLRIWSWIIPGMAILISLIGILKSFVKPILKRKSLPM